MIYVVLAAFLIYLAASSQDVFYRTISNYFSVAILVLAAIRWGIDADLHAALWAGAYSLVTLFVTASLFFCGCLGGGDVKLMSASIFLVGSKAAFSMLFTMTILGGALALILLLCHGVGLLLRPAAMGSDGKRMTRQRPTVPYGVAISLAASWELLGKLS